MKRNILEAIGATVAWAAIAAAQTSLTSLQSAPAPLTTIMQTTGVPGDTFYTDCTSPSSSTIFPQGACPRMASRKCVALGYKDGWFEGDLQGSNPIISCVK